MPCRACRLNNTNNFAAHKPCFTSVYLCEYVVKYDIIEPLAVRVHSLLAQLFGCLSWLRAKLGTTLYLGCSRLGMSPVHLPSPVTRKQSCADNSMVLK